VKQRESEADARPCGRCEKRPRKPGQRVCGPCHAQYMREWRRRKREEFAREMQELADIRARQIARRRPGLEMQGLADKYADR
jgi:hypothetical protein